MRTFILGKVHFMASKYDPQTRAKAVRLVLEHRDDYPSEWAAITAVSKRLGMNAETLRNWIRQQQVDAGERDGVLPHEERRGRLEDFDGLLELGVTPPQCADLGSCLRRHRS
jgi:transposase-like protein